MVDIDYTSPNKKETLQKLEEKAAKAQEAYEREAKAKKELEDLYSKILAEKTELLGQLEGEKGSLSEFQERANKLQAQKSDLESQLSVSKFPSLTCQVTGFVSAEYLFYTDTDSLVLVKKI